MPYIEAEKRPELDRAWLRLAQGFRHLEKEGRWNILPNTVSSSPKESWGFSSSYHALRSVTVEMIWAAYHMDIDTMPRYWKLESSMGMLTVMMKLVEQSMFSSLLVEPYIPSPTGESATPNSLETYLDEVRRTAMIVFPGIGSGMACAYVVMNFLRAIMGQCSEGRLIDVLEDVKFTIFSKCRDHLDELRIKNGDVPTYLGITPKLATK